MTFETRLIDLALARKITWTQAAALLDAADADLRAQERLDDILTGRSDLADADHEPAHALSPAAPVPDLPKES